MGLIKTFYQVKTKLNYFLEALHSEPLRAFFQLLCSVGAGLTWHKYGSARVRFHCVGVLKNARQTKASLAFVVLSFFLKIFPEIFLLVLTVFHFCFLQDILVGLKITVWYFWFASKHCPAENYIFTIGGKECLLDQNLCFTATSILYFLHLYREVSMKKGQTLVVSSDNVFVTELTTFVFEIHTAIQCSKCV